MWKAFLSLLIPFENKFSRSLLSFRSVIPIIKIEYDASLMGMGIVISKQEMGHWCIIQHVGMKFPFGELIKNDSSYQNSCEFIAIVMAIFLCALLGFRDFSFYLYGDNVSSLSWANHGGGISSRAKSASIALSLINIRIQSRLYSVTHVPGKLNIVTDGLSRGKTCQELGLDTITTSSREHCLLLNDFLMIINPFESFKIQGNHSSVRQRILKILGGLMR